MVDHKLKFHSKIPLSFVDKYAINISAKEKTAFDISDSYVAYEFEDGTAVFIDYDIDYLSVYASRAFTQKILSNSRQVTLDFNDIE